MTAAFFFFVALVAGLFMFMLGKGKVEKIGEMLLFASILSFLIAIAPAAVSKLLH